MSGVEFPPSEPSLSPRATNDLTYRITWLVIREGFIRWLLFGCAFLSVITTVGIVVVLVGESLQFFRAVSAWDFFTGLKWNPDAVENPSFGIVPLLVATLMISLISSAVGLPIGLMSAIYMSEYASPKARNFLKPTLEVLAGVPTIVYGYFALAFVTPYILKPLFGLFGIEVGSFNALSAGIIVGVMIIPTISSLSEDVMRAVPRGLREAAYALGCTKFDVSVRVVVPAAFSGIVSAFLLAFARAIGETMAVTVAAGQSPNLTFNPLNSIQTMTAFIVRKSQGEAPVGTVEYASLYAVAMTLFMITLATNLVAVYVLRRYREVYQ